MGLPAPALATTSTAWTIQAGDFDGPSGAEVTAFYPRSITVHAGDTIKFDSRGLHTVTFNPPPLPIFAFFGPSGPSVLTSADAPLNLGILGPSTLLTIGPALPAGSYPFRCMLHELMTGTIKVIPPSAKLPKLPGDYIAQAARESAADLARAVALAVASRTDLNFNQQGDFSGEAVAAGVGNGHAAVLRFFPDSVTIQAGESVLFQSQDPYTPHTVTFGKEPDFPGLFASGPPPNVTSDPLQPLHSGWLASPRFVAFSHLPLQPRTDFTVQFTRPGIYRYVCLLHDREGMVGEVIVT